MGEGAPEDAPEDRSDTSWGGGYPFDGNTLAGPHSLSYPREDRGRDRQAGEGNMVMGGLLLHQGGVGGTRGEVRPCNRELASKVWNKARLHGQEHCSRFHLRCVT